jgi:hypothetical protein
MISSPKNISSHFTLVTVIFVPLITFNGKPGNFSFKLTLKKLINVLLFVSSCKILYFCKV